MADVVAVAAERPISRRAAVEVAAALARGSDVMKTKRARAFTVVTIACVVTIAAAIIATARDHAATGDSGGAAALLASHASGSPLLMFRSLDGPTSGQLGVVPAGKRNAAVRYASLRCDRVYYRAGTGLCVGRGGGFAAGYRAAVFGPDFRVRRQLDLGGTPSRARVSRDGRLGAVTMFVTGHAYADAGTFSTATTLIDMRTGAKIANLEDFTVSRHGRVVTALDINYWGVTFAPDDDHFYATLATGGKTYLVRGSIRDRTMRTLHENVECPSLSPDDTRIAYKKRVGSGRLPWRLTVLDLKTMRETPLAERDGIDDQPEWLDDQHVLYGMGNDVRVVAADGSGRPERYRAGANSPAVVR